MAEPRPRTDPVVWIILAVVLALVVPGVLMMSFFTGWMMPFGTFGMPLWGSAAMLGGVVVTVLVILILARAVQAVPPPAPAGWAPPPFAYPGYPAPAAGNPALQALDARYAKGEISRDEYLRVRADLEGRAR